MNPTPQLWKVCSLDEYQAPSEPTGEVVRKGVRSFWRRLLDISSPAAKETELEPAEPASVKRLYPEWDLNEAGEALGEHLEDWLEGGAGPRVLVGPPFSATEAAVRRLAGAQELPVLEAPLPEEILRGGGEWPERFSQALAEGPVAVPRLERCFLRHADGFDLIRGMLDQLAATSSARCLIQCQSWAWALIGRFLAPQTVLGTPLTFEPINRQRLRLWLEPVLNEPGATVILRADNAELLWRTDRAEEEDTAGLDNLFTHIAGRARGIPEVNRAIWRECLQRRPLESDVPNGASSWKDYRAVWVIPWNQLSLPTVPGSLSRSELFVLHALLVHGGASASTLTSTLSASNSQTNRWLLNLEWAGLASRQAEEWNVLPLAYPAVRAHLGSEGFLQDEF